jgi:chromosome segregation protein
MKFNRLRLVGFKSFVEPVEFVIERGLTGVVGPNGCGKSNLVEALRWVMGENSYKNMRASGMDDVIFSGSGNRPARNTAEVALHLDNSDRTAPAAFNDSDEIQVSRRIEREQGSVYRINGKEARAKDVQLLFADASTGARSPSMVGQGRIGELIQAKPQARRQLLEEAAGISGLHSRRHEAELRLKGAETNLERLEDVTSQLESQIESLKRQARQASRFKMLSADIRGNEAMLLHIRYTEARDAEQEADAALNFAMNLVAEKAQSQMEAAKHQAITSLKLPELRDTEARMAAALQRLQIARSQLEDDVARILRRSDELARRLSQLAEDMRREESQLADNAAILENLAREAEALTGEIDNSAEISDEARGEVEAAAAALAASEASFAQATSQRAEAGAHRQQIERLLSDLAERRNRLQRQMMDANREVDVLDHAMAALPDPQEHRDQVDEMEHRLEQADRTIEEMEWAISQARSEEAASRQPVEDARKRVNALEAEASTIRRMLEASAPGGGFAAIADALSVDRGFETALGAALGEDLESATDPAAPRYWLETGSGQADPALPEGATPLLAHVRGPKALARRLAQIGLVKAEQAAGLQRLLKPGQRLVSLEGGVWRWDGHVAGADAPGAAALRLAQKNRLDEMGDEIDAAKDLLADRETVLAKAALAIAQGEARLRDAREQHKGFVRALTEAREKLVEAERASGDLARRKAVIAETLSQLTAQNDEMGEQESDAHDALADMPDLSSLDIRLREQQSIVMLDRATLAEARVRFEGLTREKDAANRRLLAIAQERNTWETRGRNAQNQIETLKARMEEAQDEAEALVEAPDAFDDKRRNLMHELEKAEAARKQAADLLAESENQQREADRLAAIALSQLAEVREKRGRAEERLVAAREKRQDTEARIRTTLNCAPHEAIRQTGRPAGAPLPDPRDVERELDRLKIERERLGAVNLRAEEEQQELTQKRDALFKERDDVIDAIKKLRAAIQSLNREGRERLLAAFDVVNVQFQRLFTHLFNGGTAELQLIESDDPLEAGLEILARPPGKKPQTMTLLSGGEQALTAMALIFAVFLTNPAPICVLDEVDAPLDDHNVERYCNLMDEMAASTDTRFVIITHNPITMARMDRLFGVTMAEQGVSQLVSVDLQTAEQLREAV